MLFRSAAAANIPLLHSESDTLTRRCGSREHQGLMAKMPPYPYALASDVLPRLGSGSFVLVLLNLTPVLRTDYRVGVPAMGAYAELFNSDAACYGGSNQGNGSSLDSETVPWMGRAQSLRLTLPPLGALILQPRQT